MWYRAIFASLAPATLVCYLSCLRDFFWHCGSSQRIEVDKVLDYFVNFCKTKQSWGACQQKLAAIRWFLKIASLPDPTSDPAVSLFLRGLKRIKYAAPVRKQAADVGLLSELYGLLRRSDNLADRRDLCLYLLCFAGFLRASEALQLEIKDLDFSVHQGLKLTIRSSKTDRFRMGSNILISRIPNELCPVSNLEKYLNYRGNYSLTDPVFPRVVRVAGNYVFSKNHLTYSGYRTRLKQHLAGIGKNPVVYGTHSFRAGGVTAAAKEGIEKRLLMQHGRWKSDFSVDGYISDPVDKCLSVSRSAFKS